MATKESFVELCQEALEVPCAQPPAEENVGVPEMPTLKNAFQLRSQDPSKNKNVAWWGPSHYGHPVTPGLESVYNSGHPQRQGGQSGDVQPPLPHTFVPGSGGPDQAHHS